MEFNNKIASLCPGYSIIACVYVLFRFHFESESLQYHWFDSLIAGPFWFEWCWCWCWCLCAILPSIYRPFSNFACILKANKHSLSIFCTTHMHCNSVHTYICICNLHMWHSQSVREPVCSTFWFVLHPMIGIAFK